MIDHFEISDVTGITELDIAPAVSTCLGFTAV